MEFCIHECILQATINYQKYSALQRENSTKSVTAINLVTSTMNIKHSYLVYIAQGSCTAPPQKAYTLVKRTG